MAYKFSIVIPYWNRFALLFESLNRFQELYKEYNLEISIYEDGSTPDQKLEPEMFSKYSFPVIYQYGEQRDLPACPVMAINRAAEKCAGDIICIQSAEVYHLDPVLKEIDGYGDKFWVAPNIALDKDTSGIFLSEGFIWDISKIQECSIISKSYINPAPEIRWTAHPSYKPTPLSQFMAIPRGTWEKIGGFSEQYANGNSYGDQDILMKLIHAGYEYKWLQGNVIHLYHGENYCSEYQIKAGIKNRRIFEKKWGIAGDQIDQFYKNRLTTH